MLTELRLNLLNREASSEKNKPYIILNHLKIRKKMVIGDIGSGGGYFASEFSKRTGDNGLVYAIDVKQDYLDYIRVKSEKEGIKNLKTILAANDHINLPKNSVDLFFLRNVFHHLPEPVEYFKKLKHLLKQNGQIAIIDFKNKKLNLMGLLGHFTPYNKLLEIMNQAGFYPTSSYDFLDDQLFVKFNKKI
jgi:ubiquinone/menaquinone biosynthesis C-methylase UbiE